MILLAEADVKVLEGLLLRKLELSGVWIVDLPEVLVVGRVVRTGDTDVIASKVGVATAFLEVWALSHVKDEAIAANINFSVRPLTIKLAYFIKCPGCLPIILNLVLHVLSFRVATNDSSEIQETEYKSKAHQNVAKVEFLAHFFIFHFKCLTWVHLLFLAIHTCLFNQSKNNYD